MFSKTKGGIVLLIAVILGALFIGGVGGAVAGDLIGSKDVKNNSLRSVDLKDGKAVGIKDLKPGLLALVKKHAQDGTNGVNGKDGAAGPAGKDGADGTPGSAAGVSTNWVEKDGADIQNDTEVHLSNVDAPAGASLEIENLNLPVQALKTLSFSYELADGAVYAAGSPRVFLEINGNFFNTFDGAPSDAGVDNGDGTFTKTVTIPQNGRVGAAGIVVDNGVGTVSVFDVTIDGKVLHFK